MCCKASRFTRQTGTSSTSIMMVLLSSNSRLGLPIKRLSKTAHDVYGGLVNHLSRSQIASDRIRSQTLRLQGNPAERADFWCPICHSIAIAGFGFSDRYLITLRGSTQRFAMIGTLVSANLCSTNLPPPGKRHLIVRSDFLRPRLRLQLRLCDLV